MTQELRAIYRDYDSSIRPLKRRDCDSHISHQDPRISFPLLSNIKFLQPAFLGDITYGGKYVRVRAFCIRCAFKHGIGVVSCKRRYYVTYYAAHTIFCCYQMCRYHTIRRFHCPNSALNMMFKRECHMWMLQWANSLREAIKFPFTTTQFICFQTVGHENISVIERGLSTEAEFLLFSLKIA